ncbi:hypothetical protein IV203_033470 [Nitzschia inconspicua]|uniref:Uncharacterized protein n=1 Tax=Nitzschia inconspicua TaxID=303405 RepID=A0A9K3K5Z8_9STRA|nr:hypothetical protein IV203_033470 [Nitzschia inconspicua]
MLDLAAEFDMDIDLHIDESNDPHCAHYGLFVGPCSKPDRRDTKAMSSSGIVVLYRCKTMTPKRSFVHNSRNLVMLCRRQSVHKLESSGSTWNETTVGRGDSSRKPRTPQWRGGLCCKNCVKQE